jgi:hypothetical protein
MPRCCSVDDLLPRVRRVVLQLRAETEAARPCSFGLSWLTWRLVDLPPAQRGIDRRGRGQSAFKSIRGKTQACLAILAREGVMYGRTRPEAGVQRYEHGETDKRFRVRVSAQEAERRLGGARQR